jgi:hypothetical protein
MAQLDDRIGKLSLWLGECVALDVDSGKRRLHLDRSEHRAGALRCPRGAIVTC